MISDLLPAKLSATRSFEKTEIMLEQKFNLMMGVCERCGAGLETISQFILNVMKARGYGRLLGSGPDDLFHFADLNHLGYTQNIYQRSHTDP